MQADIASTTPATAPQGRFGPRRHQRAFAPSFALICLAGFAIRLGFVLAGGGSDTSGDGIYYHFAANVLADGGGYVNPWNGMPTALHPPAWPALLALPTVVGWDTLLAHQVFAAFVGTATIPLVGLAARLVGGTRVGLLAAALTAANPNLWAA